MLPFLQRTYYSLPSDQNYSQPSYMKKIHSQLALPKDSCNQVHTLIKVWILLVYIQYKLFAATHS